MEVVMVSNGAKSPGGFVRYVTEERRYWFLLALILGVVALLKGIRAPNRWSATQAQLSYEQGFIKRGLFGSTVGHWLHLEHFGRFTVVSFVLLAALVAMLLLLMLRLGAACEVQGGMVAAVFCSSFTVTYLAHMVGYFDIPLALMTAGLLLIRDVRYRFAAALPVCVVALLLHEMFLIVFLPALLVSFIIDGLRADANERWMAFAMAALLLAMCLGLTFKLALRRPLDAPHVEALRANIARRTDFPLDAQVFRVLTLSTGDNLALMRRDIFPDRKYRLELATSVVSVLPTVSLLLVAIWRSLDQLDAELVRNAARVVAFAAGLSPLLMHLLGWDVTRFSALAGLTCLLVLVAVRPLDEGRPLSLPLWYRHAAVLAIALGMASGEGFMDSASPNLFPFRSNAVGLRSWIVNRDPPLPAK